MGKISKVSGIARFVGIKGLEPVKRPVLIVGIRRTKI